ncbi:hypothetical protein BI037_gp06 [Morganella phage vB_MmoP_MP2]|uniref:Uncharacterized protein n=1 Tax=Morganella phage vB_MmoP_MP2 TaxID=1852627 RepID=A0A192Y9D0_9CAUD|nr:hypothetical protein BI037_gp06 [Morganella phage vB_MmoP_MP2]ANM46364.1 hypothetical protein MP2_gp06 [Morganella phage vB_MmoP_MP2]
MKLNRLRKNMAYVMCYSGTFKRFRKNLRKSPDKGLSRIPARKLKAEWNQVMFEVTCRPHREDSLKAMYLGLRYGISCTEETFAVLSKWFAEIDAGEVH